MWIAGSEPAELRALGTSTNLPEKYGVDVMWRVKGGYVGAQRKELSDLLASDADGRLAKETQQMQDLAQAFLIVEGRPKWTNDGFMWMQFGRSWTRKRYQSMLRSVAVKGIVIEETQDLQDTIKRVYELVEWSRKPHTSLSRRPGPTSSWGKADNRDYQLHLIQGLPGIGYELAERILDQLGMPFGWCVTREDLLSVPGIGKRKADTIYRALRVWTYELS